MPWLSQNEKTQKAEPHRNAFAISMDVLAQPMRPMGELRLVQSNTHVT